MVCVDRIVSTSTDQAEGDNVLVGVQVISYGLVKLNRVSTLNYLRYMLGNLPLWVAY